MSLKVKLIVLLLLIGCIAVLFQLTALGSYVDLQRILESRDSLLLKVEDSFLTAGAVFILAYIAVTGLSIPGATVLTLLGGFFFGPWIGTLLVNIGATIGAVLIFLAARYFLGLDIQRKYEEKLSQLNREIAKNGKNYMLTLRLIPVFPFFLINLLSGFTSLPLRTFVWTTSLGIIPGSFVYAYLGSTGASSFGSGVFKIRVTIALVLLGILSLVPPLIQKVRERKSEKHT